MRRARSVHQRRLAGRNVARIDDPPPRRGRAVAGDARVTHEPTRCRHRTGGTGATGGERKLESAGLAGAGQRARPDRCRPGRHRSHRVRRTRARPPVARRSGPHRRRASGSEDDHGRRDCCAPHQRRDTDARGTAHARKTRRAGSRVRAVGSVSVATSLESSAAAGTADRAGRAASRRHLAAHRRCTRVRRQVPEGRRPARHQGHSAPMPS